MRKGVCLMVLVVGSCGPEEVDEQPTVALPAAVTVAAAADPEITAMVGAVTGSRMTTDLTRLVSFGTRNSCSTTSSSTEGIGAARSYVRDRFRAAGLPAEYDLFTSSFCGFSRTHRNVYAWIPGSDPTRLVVVGGHMDSRSTNVNSKTQPAPGANDSGSQTSVVLEAARAMVGRTFQATVLFASFTGEEQGLNGSKALVSHLGNLFPGARVEAALISDIVGGDVSANDETSLQQFRLYATGTPRERSSSTPDGTTDDTSPARGLMRAIALATGGYAADMTLLPRLREDRPGRGSDHISFLDKALPGVRFIEARENTSHQHSGNDTIANMTPDYMPRIARVMVAAAASLARAPAAPSSLSVTGTATSAIDARWSAPSSAVDHYVLAARPVSASFYVKRITVSGATSATVTASQLGITGGASFFLSVAAVDAAGHESLFAYPEFRCSSTCEVQPGSLDVTRTL
jgi:hypothetical protein